MVKMPVIASAPGARRGPLQSLSCEGSRSFIRGGPSPSFPKSFEPLVENVACLGHVGCPLIVFQGGGCVSWKGRWAESGPALERACPGQAEPPLQPALSRFRGPGESRGGGARPQPSAPGRGERPGAEGAVPRPRGFSPGSEQLGSGLSARQPGAGSHRRLRRRRRPHATEPSGRRPPVQALPVCSHAFPLVEGRASFLNLSAL